MPVIDRQEIETVFSSNLRPLEQAVIQYGNRIEAGFRRQERAQRRANRNISRGAERLSRDLRRAFVGIGLGVLSREIVQLGDDYTDMVNKVRAASSVSGLEGRNLESLAAFAADARAELSPFVDLYSRVLRAAGNYVDSEEEVIGLTTTISKAFQAGGASAEEFASGVTQLGQAIGSGALQGDEFRSLREGAPLIIKALSDSLGVAQGELKELSAQGELTSEVVIAALQSQGAEIDRVFQTTTPRATAAAAQAFDRLSIAVGRYVNEQGVIAEGSQKAAGLIDFLANNLETLTDVTLVASAALIGFFGASTAASVLADLQKTTRGVQGAQRAVVVLKAVSQGFGGPLVLGATALAGAFAFVLLRADGATAAIERLEGTLESYNQAADRVAADQQRLTSLNDALTEAIANQQTAIADTLRLDIDALNQRIAKNKELQDVLGISAEAQLSQAREELGRLPSAVSEPNLRDILTPEEARQIGSGGLFGNQQGAFDLLGAEELARRTEAFQEREIDRIRRKVRLGERLTRQEQGVINRLEARAELEERIAGLSEQVANLAPPSVNLDNFGGLDRLLESQRAGGDDGVTGEVGGLTDAQQAAAKRAREAAVADTRKALDEIESAFRDTFEEERAQIERTYLARLNAIDQADIAQGEADRLRLQAELVYREELEKVRLAEQAIADQRKSDAEEQRDREIGLLNDVLALREEASGRALALINREFDARRAELEAEITDFEIQTEALVALEEERQRRIDEVRAAALAQGAQLREDLDPSSVDPFQAEIDSVTTAAAARIDAIREAYGVELLVHREAQAEIVAILRAAGEEVVALQQDRLLSYINDVSNIAGSIGQVLGDTLGETNAATRAFLAVQQGLAAAELSISAARGFSKAISVGFPQNLPLFAGVAAQVAQVTALLAGARGFADGGYTGNGGKYQPAGIVHAGEFVVDQDRTRKIGVDNLEWLRRNPDAIRRLRGYAEGGFVTLGSRASQLAPAASAGVINATSGGLSIDASTSFNGPINNETMPQLEAALANQRASILRDVPRLMAAEVGNGGGVFDRSVKRAYGLGRAGYK